MMTVINGNSLLKLAPIKNMETSKQRYEGTSYGLSEAGYDIRIAEDILFTSRGKIKVTSKGHTTFTDGKFTLASAIEEFQMPSSLVGCVTDKSTWARQGLSVFNTVIEPGWNGFLTLELVYYGNESLKIKAGQGIAQVLFHQLAEEASYGDGKYQNQEAGPQKARS